MIDKKSVGITIHSTMHLWRSWIADCFHRLREDSLRIRQSFSYTNRTHNLFPLHYHVENPESFENPLSKTNSFQIEKSPTISFFLQLYGIIATLFSGLLTSFLIFPAKKSYSADIEYKFEYTAQFTEINK